MEGTIKEKIPFQVGDLVSVKSMPREARFCIIAFRTAKDSPWRC